MFAAKFVDLGRMRLRNVDDLQRDLKKLHREVDILKKLPVHANVVKLVDIFEDGEWFALVLELVMGGTLFGALVGRSPAAFREAETAFVLRQLASGLSFLHGEDVIHRDLKLENVLVASARRRGKDLLHTVKIADFGLSRMVGSGFSEARSFVGTPHYVAPEVAHDDRSHDYRADLWSLGVLTFVLLVGRFPYDNLADTSQVTLDIVLAESDIGTSPLEVVSGLLQMEPESRWELSVVKHTNWLVENENAYPVATNKRKLAVEELSQESKLQGSSSHSAVEHKGAPATDMLPAALEPSPAAVPPQSSSSDESVLVRTTVYSADSTLLQTSGCSEDGELLRTSGYSCESALVHTPSYSGGHHLSDL